ncbi:Type II toxin-antitoxin system ParD family antitoxin [Sulfidibacter corallicola]|uniref:Type II toxin-antitoxin system ParD family antitoxin n=1 Tax=Sulfidibacter corallicola TaxID=2818388 RepID=A0A8A4TIZ3_SULCO|nr:type II toxin-antitoxin system ParD family antitoxin [Sulfidibacter corallicola]QTD49457.1 type II toxin-antitoxin system ParD family antitoxin [Sulfidibacter corallicola]
MVKSVSFTLGEHDRNFISNMVSSGRFGNKTEVVRAGLRMLEDYENKQKALRSLIDLGFEDIKAGRTTEYESAESLLNDIMED